MGQGRLAELPTIAQEKLRIVAEIQAAQLRGRAAAISTVESAKKAIAEAEYQQNFLRELESRFYGVRNAPKAEEISEFMKALIIEADKKLKAAAGNPEALAQAREEIRARMDARIEACTSRAELFNLFNAYQQAKHTDILGVRFPLRTLMSDQRFGYTLSTRYEDHYTTQSGVAATRATTETESGIIAKMQERRLELPEDPKLVDYALSGFQSKPWKLSDTFIAASIATVGILPLTLAVVETVSSGIAACASIMTGMVQGLYNYFSFSSSSGLRRAEPAGVEVLRALPTHHDASAVGGLLAVDTAPHPDNVARFEVSPTGPALAAADSDSFTDTERGRALSVSTDGSGSGATTVSAAGSIISSFMGLFKSDPSLGDLRYQALIRRIEECRANIAECSADPRANQDALDAYHRDYIILLLVKVKCELVRSGVIGAVSCAAEYGVGKAVTIASCSSGVAPYAETHVDVSEVLEEGYKALPTSELVRRLKKAVDGRFVSTANAVPTLSYFEERYAEVSGARGASPTAFAAHSTRGGGVGAGASASAGTVAAYATRYGR